jgi:hypothetical protein
VTPLIWTSLHERFTVQFLKFLKISGLISERPLFELGIFRKMLFEVVKQIDGVRYEPVL